FCAAARAEQPRRHNEYAHLLPDQMDHLIPPLRDDASPVHSTPERREWCKCTKGAGIAVRTLTSVDRLASDIAEFALACTDSASLALQLLERLRLDIDFDLASFHGMLDGAQSMHAIGYDAEAAGAKLNVYMAEFEPKELAAVSCGRPMIDTEV